MYWEYWEIPFLFPITFFFLSFHSCSIDVSRPLLFFFLNLRADWILLGNRVHVPVELFIMRSWRERSRWGPEAIYRMWGLIFPLHHIPLGQTFHKFWSTLLSSSSTGSHYTPSGRGRTRFCARERAGSTGHLPAPPLSHRTAFYKRNLFSSFFLSLYV